MTTPKVWFITGCSRGLGRAIAERALESGASVIAKARNTQQLQELVTAYGPDRVFPVALDVANYDGVVKAVSEGHEKFGRIDVVVNNVSVVFACACTESFCLTFGTGWLCEHRCR